MNSFDIADEKYNFFLCNKCINVLVCRIEVKAESLVPFVWHTYVLKKNDTSLVFTIQIMVGH